MPNKTFLVKLKPPSFAIQQVVASTVEIHDKHLIFCDSGGRLAGRFLLEIVQSWNEISRPG